MLAQAIRRTAIKEKSHTTWGWDWLEDFFEDIRYDCLLSDRTCA
jgi:hypothetical protein